MASSTTDEASRVHVARVIGGIGRQAMALRFDALALEMQSDWHEPIEQGVSVVVFGTEFDNAHGCYIDLNQPEGDSEIVVVLMKNGAAHCSRNLASLMAEAAAYRRGVKVGKINPSDVFGPVV